MKKIFINHTNHRSDLWSAEQIAAAEVYGEIFDVPFPAVKAEASTAEVHKLVCEHVEKILAAEPSCVLCQGEFNYTFEAVSRLKSAGVKVVAATSERCVRAEVLPDGSTRQVSTFRFVQFREY